MKRIYVLAMAAASSAAMAQTWYGPGPGGAIPDGPGGNNTAGPPLVSDIVISGTGLTIASFNAVRINGFTHTFLGDLTVVLSKVGGASTDIMDRNYRTTTTGAGMGEGLDGTYVFTAGGGSMVGAGDPVAPGTYGRFDNPTAGSSAASGTYASYTGVALDGTWRLTFNDWFGADTGAITSWEFNVTPVPEPATMLALVAGVGALAARRRRK